MISCTTDNFNAWGACTTPVLTSKASWLFTKILGSFRGYKTGTSSCKIPFFRLPNTVLWVILFGLTCSSLVVATFTRIWRCLLLCLQLCWLERSNFLASHSQRLRLNWLSVDLKQDWTYQQYQCYRPLLLPLPLMSCISRLLLKSSRLIMVYCSGHCNWLYYFTITYDTYPSNIPCTFVHMWHQVCSRSFFQNLNILKYIGALMTELSLTGASSSFVSFFAYFNFLLLKLSLFLSFTFLVLTLIWTLFG